MDAIVRALSMAFAMGWEILWPLILGFTLSGIVQAVVSHSEMSRLLPDDRPRSIATALGLGAASSSCSYAAVALARSIFRKGANFTAAMAFEASTKLVLELSIIIIVLMGWQFALAEFVGAPIMVAVMVLLFRTFLSPGLLREAKEQADRGITGRMEGMADMDMAVTEGSLWQRITSDEGRTAISHSFVMDWASVWMDIVGGLLIAGALAAWNNGISFGGVIAFIFADLIVLPILDIYRKYYGLKMTGFLLTTFYTAMAAAALIVEAIFAALGLIPTARQAQVVEASISWNYTTWLNIVFLILAALLVWRFLTTGGPEMLRMMNAPARSEMHS